MKIDRPEDEKGLVLYRDLTPAQAKDSLRAIRAFQAAVRSEMVEGHDYGIIPGTQKPTLLKPGAEKMAKLLGCSDRYEVLNQQEDWEKPFFYYMVKCTLYSMSSDVVISEGIGSANSYEAKWRYRWLFGSEVPDHIDKNSLVKRTSKARTGKPYTQYRMENEDIYSQVNTIQKMAKKRALVDAALSAGRLSDLFTQDIEEMTDFVTEGTYSETTAEQEDNKADQGEQRQSEKQRMQTAAEEDCWRLVTRLGIDKGSFESDILKYYEAKSIAELKQTKWAQIQKTLRAREALIEKAAETLCFGFGVLVQYKQYKEWDWGEATGHFQMALDDEAKTAELKEEIQAAWNVWEHEKQLELK